MRVVSSAWVSGSLAEFEAACCLGVHARLGLASAGSPFDIFILQGYEKLTVEFIRSLGEAHVRLHNVGGLADRYTVRYRRLFDLMNPGQGGLYEVFCFIRWLVIEEALAGESFVHIDLDLFFQFPLARIAELFEGKTGTFGSPCLTAVSSREWLAGFREALDVLVADRSALQAALNYSGNEFRKDISSDQDLVAALELSGRLPRDGLAALHSDFQVFVNPLWPYQHKSAKPMLYERRDRIDTMDGKSVLFWHLQNNFADYISRFAIVNNFEQTWLKQYLPVRLQLPFIQLAPSAENFAFHSLRELAWHRIRETLAAGGDISNLGVMQFFARTWVSTWFILQGDGRRLLSRDYWWEDGVFV